MPEPTPRKSRRVDTSTMQELVHRGRGIVQGRRVEVWDVGIHAGQILAVPLRVEKNNQVLADLALRTCASIDKDTLQVTFTDGSEERWANQCQPVRVLPEPVSADAS